MGMPGLIACRPSRQSVASSSLPVACAAAEGVRGDRVAGAAAEGGRGGGKSSGRGHERRLKEHRKGASEEEARGATEAERLIPASRAPVAVAIKRLEQLPHAQALLSQLLLELLR